MACIDTQTGRSLWDLRGTSSFLAEARVSPDDERVYVIQSVDGRIFCHDQLTGALQWVSSCDQFQEDCSNSVRADFTLSTAGESLYYGDVLGRIIALQVGDLVERAEPTATSPNSPGGTSGPGVAWPTNNSNNPGEKSSRSRPAVAASVALIVLASMIVVGSTMYILMINRFKSVPHPQQEPQNLIVFGNSLPTDPGLDPYEDSMISQHAATKQSLADEAYDDWYNEPIIIPQARSKSLNDSFDTLSHAAADRISLLLGTSNRITPIQEDYSYGAAVFV
jgi:hypothetical protein